MRASRCTHRRVTALLRPSACWRAKAPSPPPPLKKGPAPAPSTAPSPAASSGADHRVPLEKVFEKTLAADRALASQQETLSHVQRHQLLVDRRIAEVEDMAMALQGQVTEARRAAGEVALRQQNVEMLVEQMEQRVLAMVAHAPASSAATVPDASAPPLSSFSEAAPPQTSPGEQQQSRAPRETEEKEGQDDVEEEGEEDEEGFEIAFNDDLREEVRKLIREVIVTEGTALLSARKDAPATAAAAASTSAPLSSSPSSIPPAATAGSHDALAQQLAELDKKLDTLQAQMAQLTLHKVDLTTAASSAASHGSDSGLNRNAMPEDDAVLQKTADRLAEQIRLCGLVPFSDHTGATRVASQVVALHHVPANMGAAEVREMCVRACGRDSVVSCVVRRGADAASSRSTVAAAIAGTVRSHASSPYGAERSRRAPSPTLSSSDRVFHVTFATAQLAVRAIGKLNGLAVHASPAAGSKAKRGSGDAAPALVVEPIVSSDLQAALRALETREDHSSSSSCPSKT